MLESIVEIARRAGELVEECAAGRGFASELKSDGSPVSEADVQADAFIRSELQRLAPSIPCLSEETPVLPYAVRSRWDRFWLVDPLDGTKEFLAGRDDFTVNIALIEAGVPTLGAVYAPRRKAMYFASKDSGAWRALDKGVAERIYSSESPNRGLTIVESRSHPSAELESFLSTIQVARRIQVGSSLKFCLVAEGTADLYPRMGPTMEWDVAAGDCVYRYSGRNGERPSSLRYNKPDLKNSSFIIGLDRDAIRFES